MPIPILLMVAGGLLIAVGVLESKSQDKPRKLKSKPVTGDGARSTEGSRTAPPPGHQQLDPGPTVPAPIKAVVVAPVVKDELPPTEPPPKADPGPDVPTKE